MTTEQPGAVPDDVIAAIDAELAQRFGPHAGDPLYDEIRRVRRAELIEIEQKKRSDAE